MNRFAFYLVCVAILVVLASPIITHAATGDLELSVIHDGGLNPPGSTGQVSIVIKNNGPEALAASFRLTDIQPDSEFATSKPVEFFYLNGPCLKASILPPPNPVFFQWSTENIAPFDHIACNWEFVVDKDTTLDQVLFGWTVWPRRLADSDPNAMNNTDSAIIVIMKASTIPALSASAIALFIILLLGIGGISIRKS